MKRIQNHHPFLRGLLLALSLMLALSGSMLTAFAQDDFYTTWEYVSSTGGIDATFPDGSTIAYTPAENLTNRIRAFRFNRFYYENPVEYGKLRITVEAPAYASDFLYLDKEDLHLASREGQKTLRKLSSGEGVSRYIISMGSAYTATVSSLLLSDLSELDSSAATTYTLFDLKDVNRYEIFGMEGSGYYGVLLGYVFETEEGLFYADASDLPDTCFSANAELLPKTTNTISLVPLTQEVSDDCYKRISSLSLQPPSYEYESEYFVDHIGNTDDVALGMAYATVILLGILLPVAPTVAGFVAAHKSSRKRWRLLSFMGILWMILGVILLILLIAAA
jgi:hypothetical protein